MAKEDVTSIVYKGKHTAVQVAETHQRFENGVPGDCPAEYAKELLVNDRDWERVNNGPKSKGGSGKPENYVPSSKEVRVAEKEPEKGEVTP